MEFTTIISVKNHNGKTLKTGVKFDDLDLNIHPDNIKIAINNVTTSYVMGIIGRKEFEILVDCLEFAKRHIETAKYLTTL